jgi:serine protease Do
MNPFFRAAMLAAAVAAGPLVAPPALAQIAPQSFADLADRLQPAVVNISTRQRMGDVGPELPDVPEGSPFEDLFRDFFERNQQGPRTQNSLGSGFVIDPSGYVVTNNHVIENADEIIVNFPGGEQRPAELIGADPKTDIALLKVEPDEPLDFVPWGDSDAMRVGDWVVAIGNPFGLGGSVSAGIISARDRDINAGPYDDFIQTDAAINRGNSGGPLFNLEGEVIGVNTAIISPTGGSIGIGFAVPSDLAANVVTQLREYGETRRGWLGVRIQEVTPEIAESLELDESYGALVADATAGGPAAEAGVEAGDVILRFDGERVESMRELPRMVADTAIGETVRVVVWRKGESRTLRVTLGRLEEGEVIEASLEAAEKEDSADTLGMTLEPLTAQQREELGLDEDVEGVLVVDVDAASAAFDKGVRRGDVLSEVAQEPVSSPAEVAERVEAAREEGRGSVLFLVNTAGELRFVAISLTEE